MKKCNECQFEERNGHAHTCSKYDSDWINQTSCPSVWKETPEDWEEEFQRVFLFTTAKREKDAREFIRKIRQEGFEEGRKSTVDEIIHEREKLLDGFAHPKDCKRCK